MSGGKTTYVLRGGELVEKPSPRLTIITTLDVGELSHVAQRLDDVRAAILEAYWPPALLRRKAP